MKRALQPGDMKPSIQITVWSQGNWRRVGMPLSPPWTGAEQRLRDNDLGQCQRIPDKETLCSLAQDLPAVWNSPSTDMRLKQRIVRILIERSSPMWKRTASEIVLLIHWTGGRHSELRMKKNAYGQAQPLHRSGND